MPVEQLIRVEYTRLYNEEQKSRIDQPNDRLVSIAELGDRQIRDIRASLLPPAICRMGW